MGLASRDYVKIFLYRKMESIKSIKHFKHADSMDTRGLPLFGFVDSINSGLWDSNSNSCEVKIWEENQSF